MLDINKTLSNPSFEHCLPKVSLRENAQITDKKYNDFITRVENFNKHNRQDY